MQNPNAVVAICDAHRDAEGAVKELRTAGFDVGAEYS